MQSQLASHDRAASVSSSGAFRVSRFHVATPPVRDEVDSSVNRLVFATRTAQIRIIDAATWIQIQAGDLSALPVDVVTDLIEIELLVPCEEDELAAVLTQNRAAINESASVRLVIQPTAYCQLGCDYCGQEHTFKWLAPDHQQLLVDYARRKIEAQEATHLEVCWFGAEPLVGLPVIRAVTPRLQQLARDTGCQYTASIVTNGVALTPAVATKLVTEHGISSIEVSIDGTAEYHDARRYRKNGKPTFDRIFQNVVALASRDDLDVVLTVRTNVDRRNCEGVTPLLRMLADAGVAGRVRYYVAPIHSWGNDADSLSLSPEEFARRELDWLCQMAKLGFSPGLIPRRVPIVCLAVEPNSTLIDATGMLFNCTEVSYVPTYGNPNKFAVGHITRGESAGKRDVLGRFNDRVEAGAYACSSCRMLPVCGGACPKAWMEGHEPCPSARRNIEGRLLLSYALSRLDADPAMAGG